MNEGRAPFGHLRPAQPGPMHERQVGAGERVVVGEACCMRPEVVPGVRERVAAVLARVLRHLPLVLAVRAHLHAAALHVRARSPGGRARVRGVSVGKAREVELGPAGRRRGERAIRGERAPEAVHIGQDAERALARELHHVAVALGRRCAGTGDPAVSRRCRARRRGRGRRRHGIGQHTARGAEQQRRRRHGVRPALPCASFLFLAVSQALLLSLTEQDSTTRQPRVQNPARLHAIRPRRPLERTRCACRPAGAPRARSFPELSDDGCRRSRHP